MNPSPDLLLAYDFPPMGGGIARWMSEIALRYPPGELIVCTGCLPGDTAADTRLPNVVSRLPLASGRLRTVQGQIRWAARVAALHRQCRFGFAWCDNIRPSAYPANVLWRMSDVPYGVLLHGSDLFDWRQRFRRSAFKRFVARRLFGDAAVVVTNSRWTGDLAREVLEELGLPQSIPRIRIVPLGTDPAAFRPDLDPAGLRQAYQLPAGLWVVTVARLELYKGVDVAIRAVAMLREDVPTLRYAVVGDGPARAELEALARSEGVADRVHFLGAVPDSMVAQAYVLADVYLGLTRQTERNVEGFGISLVEAQASGRPVLAGRGGGTADAVKDGVTGLLVDPTDPGEVARQLGTLLKDRARSAALGQAGRHEVERYYNWDRVVAELRALSAAAKLGNLPR